MCVGVCLGCRTKFVGVADFGFLHIMMTERYDNELWWTNLAHNAPVLLLCICKLFSNESIKFYATGLRSLAKTSTAVGT